MSTEKAARENAGEHGGNDAELDSAIDELRGVLRQGGEGAGAASGDVGTSGPAAPAAAGGGERDGVPAGAFAEFGDDPVAAGPSRSQLDLVMDIPIDVEIVLGSARMPVSALMELSQGSTIALDRRIGEPVEITVNGRVIGRGEITVLEEDETRFGVRLLQLETDRD